VPLLKTYVDANVLIAAFRGIGSHAIKAKDVLDDSNREFIASDILRLELIPKAHYNKRAVEEAFYESYFAAATDFVETTPALMQLAEVEAKACGLAAADAMHIVAAKQAGATEFITAEKPTKPLFRVTGITATSIRT